MPDLTPAILLYDSGRKVEAAAACVNILVRHPDYAAAHALYSLCQLALKQPVLARHHAEKAASLEPANPNHHFLLARVLTNLFDWEYVPTNAHHDDQYLFGKAVANPNSMRALQAIHDALTLDAHNASYFAQLAEIQLMLARWDEGLEAATRGMELDPENMACLHYRARAWLDMEEPAKAEEATRVLLSLNPNLAHGHAGMGDICLYRREAQAAERHYLEALRLDPLLVWAEQGLKAARQMETGRAFVREMVSASTHSDPLLHHSDRWIRRCRIAAQILVFGFASVLVLQFISMKFWPGHSLFTRFLQWLGRL